MQTITKIIRAKDKFKTLDIPKEFADKDVKVTFEPIVDFKSSSSKKTVEELNNLRKKTKNVKISDDIDIDDMINEMNKSI